MRGFGIVRFRTRDEGGRASAPSGVRSQYKTGGMLTSCSVWSLDGAADIPQGIDVPVRIDFQFWDACGQWVQPGMLIELFEGRRLIATGVLERLGDE
jgi:hypothetical protein